MIYYESIETLPLFNWDNYLKNKDKNWFRVDFDGRESKITNKELDKIEADIQDEYFIAIDDREFAHRLQKWVKIDNLTTKYNMVSMLLKRMWKGFADNEMELRERFINTLALYGFKFPKINTLGGDAEEIIKMNTKLQSLKTQIDILRSEMVEDGKEKSSSLNKQLIIMSLGLNFGYKLNAKEITVAEWVEMCKILKEKNNG
jgi:hypothetical protein